MALFRIIKNKLKFVTFNRSFLEDDALNLAARGLLAWLLQHPHDTRLSLSELTRRLPDPKKHIARAITVLQNAGYVLWAPDPSDNTAEFPASSEYHVYEYPQTTLTPNNTSLPAITLVDRGKMNASVKKLIHASQKPILHVHKINDTLSSEQKIFIQQAAAVLCEQHQNQAGEAQWRQALEKAILDKNYLARFHSNFFKKLKCLKETLNNSHMRALFWTLTSVNDSEQIKSSLLYDLKTGKTSLNH